MSQPVLLNDAQMREFIVNGYLVLHPEFPDGFNERMFERLNEVFENGGNPGNNLLPRVPQLREVWQHPEVNGAISSILGPDYYLHMHRHVHENPPGSEAQNMHKDSLHNSRYAADGNRRRHRTRWVMAFHYPQDTPVEIGPTAIIPQSQYLNVDPPGFDEVPLHGGTGTVVLVHYDLRHRKLPNTTDRLRYMNKFLFTRMSEPTGPTWNHDGRDWESSDDSQDVTWQHMWDWHRGKSPERTKPSESAATLAGALASDNEREAMRASYLIGSHGDAALPYLTAALEDETGSRPRNAAYAFNQLGSSAVPALTECSQSEQPHIRARALDILGDLGLDGEDAVDALDTSLEDSLEEARMHAAEGLGTTGQNREVPMKRLSNRLVEDESWKVRRNAALTLGRLGRRSRGVVKALSESVRDENHYVRGYSALALERIGTPAAMRALNDYLQMMRWDEK